MSEDFLRAGHRARLQRGRRGRLCPQLSGRNPYVDVGCWHFSDVARQADDVRW